MGASAMQALLDVAASSSAAILLVGLLRKPFRVAVGARAAYWLWLLVPASAFAALLPAPSHALQMMSGAMPGFMKAAVTGVAMNASTPGTSAALVAAALLVWLSGASVMLTLMISRQRTFVRSLGRMTLDANGVRRSHSIVAPMLVGAWRPQVVVPVDFEIRYRAEERRLILAHERAHQLRRDISINAFAAGWLCLFWFNPLMYWAIGRLRLDQELACDALVLARSEATPRRYADALLKTQLATESVWRMPVGCHWQSSHPLKERIAMLRRPLPGFRRRLGGIVFALLLTVSGGYAVWAAQPQARVKGTPILVKMKLTVTTSTGTWGASTEVLANSGELASYQPGRPYDARCTAFLGNEDRGPAAWVDQKARGIPIPVTGQILLECKISNAGKAVASPSVMAKDGGSAVIEFYDPEDAHHYRLDLDATTSTETIAAEKIAAEKIRKAPGHAETRGESPAFLAK
jgi:beta-lactamase regulating signal transducer with metallopeptidase domain